MTLKPHTIGELSFISGLPLSWPFAQCLVGEDDITRVSGLPGELDAQMARGTLDAAPISTLEYIRNPDRYNLVPNLSISAWGRIGSAVLFSTVPFNKLQGATIALPPHGATSNALIQWILQRMFGVEAQYVDVAGPLETLLQTHAAALVIGDRAVQDARTSEVAYQLDLGDAWWRMMKTPCVTSVWAVQRSLPLDEQQALAGMLTNAKALGLEYMDAVIAEASVRLDVPRDEMKAYFHLLNYDMTPVHEQGIRQMAEDLAEIGVVH